METIPQKPTRRQPPSMPCIKDGGQSKKASVSLAEPVIQIYGPVDKLHPLGHVSLLDAKALKHLLPCSSQQLRMWSTGMERRRQAGFSLR